MAHKRKKRRTQQPGAETNARGAGISNSNPASRVPKSMVIRMGGSDVGSSVSQLVKDVRQVMEPHTASKLRERRGNKLRDFTTMAGPLGVSHLLLFYKAPSGNVNLKLVVHPRGPTFSFHVEKYSLAKDVAKSLKRPKTGSAGNDHFQPPLLVMNNFASSTSQPHDDTGASNSIPKHLETLTTSVFQSLFPPISPQKTPLASIRRVLLVNREVGAGSSEKAPFVLNMRHYAITSKALVPLSKGLRRLQSAQRHAIRRPQDKQGPDFLAGEAFQKQKTRASRGGLPDMSRLDDVADYLLEPGAAGGYTSASESEMDLTDAEVEIVESQARRVLNKKERERQKRQTREAAEAAAAAAVADDQEEADEEDRAAPAHGSGGFTQRTQKRAIKLTEIGPRMRLRLYKVEEGVCAGRTLWHEVVTKSSNEERELEQLWETRKREKEQRRQVQKENIERKRREKEAQSKADKRNANVEADEDEGMENGWSDLEDEDMDEMVVEGQDDEEHV